MFLKCNIGSNLAKRYPGKSGLIIDGAVFLGRMVRGKKTSTFLRLDKVADATFSILGFARKQNQPECQSSSFSKCFIALVV